MRIGSVILALVGTTAGRGSTRAFAAGPCAGVRVHGAPDLTPPWAEAVGRLLAELPPIAESTCAAVTLAVEPALDGGARVVALTADGRYAERILPRPSALVATTLGLVASIPAEPPAEDRTPPSGGAAAAPPAPLVEVGPPRPATSPPDPLRLQLWLGAAIGARIGEPTGYQLFDLEARADAILRGWLVTLSFRYAPSLGPDTSDFVFDEAVIGLGVGRRLSVGRGAIDLSVVPSFATMDLRWDQDDSDPQSQSHSAFLLGVSARWSTPLSGAWSFTVTADGDVAPFWLVHPSDLGADEPAFPSWTFGLRLGASGALL
jgi:hypothetical protein